MAQNTALDQRRRRQLGLKRQAVGVFSGRLRCDMLGRGGCHTLCIRLRRLRVTSQKTVKITSWKSRGAH